MNNGLSFNTLREANKQRIGHFKNGKGELAHKCTDGSDWTPAQWLQAVVGELGEYAEVRQLYETGQMTYARFKVEAAKELADVQIYFDILCQRCLDEVFIEQGETIDQATFLQSFIVSLGSYANARKKFERGDIDAAELDNFVFNKLRMAQRQLRSLSALPSSSVLQKTRVAREGVNLSTAISDTFNSVSERVGSPIRIYEHTDFAGDVRQVDGLQV